MGFAQSKQLFRGAVTWPVPTMLAGVSIILFEKLHIRGPSIAYKFYDRENPFQLEIGSRYFTDDKPMIDFSNHKMDFRNTRGDSLNIYASTKYKFGFRNLFYVGLNVVRDLTRYQGIHSVLKLGAPVLPFTTLKLEYSLSEKSSNQYAYGHQAISGNGYIAAGLKVVVIKLPWKGIMMIDFDNYWIQKSENKHANFVGGDSVNTKLSTRIIWDI